MIWLTFYLLPFIQLGFSWYVSMASFIGLASLVSVKLLFKRLPPVNVITNVIMVCLLMWLALLSHGQPRSTEVLRTGREVFGLVILVITLDSLRRSRIETDPEKAGSAYRTFSVGMFALVSIQTFTLARGVYFGLPQNLFIRNFSTLPDALDLKYSHIRPMGTFGEPSYLAFISFAVLVAISALDLQIKRNLMTVIACVSVIVLSRSALGVLFTVMLLTYMFRSRLRHLRSWQRILLALAAFATLLTALNYRFANGTLLADASLSGRLSNPLAVLPDYVSQHILGLPYEAINQSGNAVWRAMDWSAILHNAALNLFFSYGLVALPILFILFMSARISAPIVLLLVFALVQNGDFFNGDKIAVIVLVAYLWRTVTNAQQSSKAELRPENLQIPIDEVHRA